MSHLILLLPGLAMRRVSFLPSGEARAAECGWLRAGGERSFA
jgi:hypothetical protein